MDGIRLRPCGRTGNPPKAWEKAYNALHGEFDTLRLELDEKFASLKILSISSVRLGREKFRKEKGPGGGYLSATGVDQHGNGTPAVGFGLGVEVLNCQNYSLVDENI